MPKYVNTFKRLLFLEFVIVILTFSCVYLFDELVAKPTGLSLVFHQWGRVFIVIAFGTVALFITKRSKTLLAKYVGLSSATVFQFLMMAIIGIIMLFGILDILDVPPSTLLISGGIVTIVLGFILSTMVGNFLAGTFVLMTSHYKVGDTIMVNNMPCKIEKISSLVTRVRNEAGGQIAIPNAAIMQGTVLVTSYHDTPGTPDMTRFPFKSGDRVYTADFHQEGLITDLTPLHTTILLDSGNEVTYLNTTIMTGHATVVKIQPIKQKILISDA